MKVWEQLSGRLSGHRFGSRAAVVVCLLTVTLLASTLPGPAAVADPLPPELQPSQCFLDTQGQVSCPTVLAPAELVPPATMTGLRPDAADALRAMQEQAIDNVIAGHELAATDRAAVLSYARYDALAELWGMIATAFETSKAQRSASQQAVVDWLGRRLTYLRSIAPPHAAIEYAKFAGKNVNQLEQLLYYGGTEQQIKDFLSGTPEPFNTVNKAEATGGYCRYRPPAPFEADYDGHLLQQCFTPCQSPFGCAPTTPTYDQFVKWGNTRVGSLLDSETVISQAALVAAAAGSGLVGGSLLAAGLSAASQVIWPFMTAVVGIPAGALTASAVAALAGVVAVVVAAVIIAAMVGLNVATIEEMPGKLASAIAQSRQPVDTEAMWATDDGKTTMYTLFIDAVSPAPREDMTCDNGRVDEIWQSWMNGTPVRVFAWERDNLNIHPCLNPVSVPPAIATDPHFEVRDESGAESESPTVTIAHPDADNPATIRVRGDNWFVVRRPDGSEFQSLRLHTTDWQGRNNVVRLQRTAAGYTFRGVQANADGTFDIDPDTCRQCWTDDTLKYVGPDGRHRSARIAFYEPPTGQPSHSSDALIPGSPVTFDANDFAPAGAVGAVTYEWQFQRADCGAFPCTRIEGPDFEVRPVYHDPVPGAVTSHAWPQSGNFYARLTATDSEGRQAASELVVHISSVAPRLTLARDCSLLPVPVACNNYPTTAGSQSILFGGATLTGTLDRLDVRIDWGDGTGSWQQAGYGGLPVPGSPITLDKKDEHNYRLNATHTYTEPGFYTVTVAAKNQTGAAEIRSTVLRIKGQQQISFAQPEAQHYGDDLVAPATGSDSGLPVTYTAGPADVCRASGPFGSRIVSVGVGECTVTAHQTGDNVVWTDAAPVSRTFEVLPAPLVITADDATKTYGDPDPDLTASFKGLRNGDTRAAISGLVLSGPPAGSGAGSYDIVASGASDPHYDISYVAGTLTVGKAPLTITPDDETRVYGGAKPAYSAGFDGLVNGDTADDMTGLRIEGAAKAADVGSYDIVASSADNPNYDYTYEPGTETITRAPLTITADDVTRRYGAPADHTASFDGLVNGDGPGSVEGLDFAGAPASAGVGEYPIELSGGTSPNYDIHLVDGTESVVPAPLTITADDQIRRYGAASPAYTATFDGLANGDEEPDVRGLTITGAPAGAPVGSYPIEPGGAADPNYDITFVTGIETVGRAPLTVTADDKSRTYGAPHPPFTATFDGLVNGDTPAAIAGVEFDAAPAGSDVGSYAITPRDATNPNYDFHYVAGTETITRAPLTIRADNTTVKYGTLGTYTWAGVGWVNGDGDAGIRTPPTCVATIQGAAASVHTAPGPYVGAIRCSGAEDPNYTIGYASGTLTVNPVIRLDQTGLPANLPRQASIDHRVVNLPSGDVEVAYGTGHSYSFPRVVVGRRGGTYLTRTPSFSGPVAANLIVTARYQTMAKVLSAEIAGGRVDRAAQESLRASWARVRAGLVKHQAGKTRAALQRFADDIQRRAGKQVERRSANVLLAHAQLVFKYVDGRGSL